MTSLVDVSNRPTLLLATLALLMASACTADNRPDPDAPAGSSAAAGSSASAPTPAPAIEVVDGYERLNTLPPGVAHLDTVLPGSTGEPQRARAEVVQAFRSGDVVRVVVAWQPIAAGDGEHPVVMRGVTASYEVGWELHDPGAGTIARPLRTEAGCLCTENTGAILTDQGLFWADFPAPSGDSATLVLGPTLLPLPDVPIASTAAAPPSGDLVEWSGSTPPGTPGQGATERPVRPVRRLVESIGGATRTRSGDDEQIGVPSDVLFAFDSARLSGRAQRVIRDLARTLVAAASGQRVLVVGHTDDRGEAAYNLDLSRRRAQAVAGALRPRLAGSGIRLEVAGRGEAEPLLPNRTADNDPITANQARNRRVAVAFTASQPADPAAPTLAPTARPGRPAAPAEGTAPPGSLASAGLSVAGGTLRADVVRAERRDDLVYVEAQFRAVSGDQVHWGATEEVLGANPYGSRANESFVHVAVVDPADGLRYRVLDDGEGNCLCTRAIGQGFAYETPFPMWGLFPAPPAGVDRIDLSLGRFGHLTGIPLASGPTTPAAASVTGPVTGGGTPTP